MKRSPSDGMIDREETLRIIDVLDRPAFWEAHTSNFAMAIDQADHERVASVMTSERMVTLINTFIVGTAAAMATSEMKNENLLTTLVGTAIFNGIFYGVAAARIVDTERLCHSHADQT